MEKITTEDLQRMMILSYERIDQDKEKINKINVFPVPDQDTGSNLAMTLLGVKDAIENKKYKGLAEFSTDLLDGIIGSARGNAGVIYAGFLAGLLSALQNKNPIDSQSLAFAMRKGAIKARHSIHEPKEGTILNVIDASAESINKEHKNDKDIASLFKKAIREANLALLVTRDKMEILKKANVVDAGGLGYLIILESYLEALGGTGIKRLDSKKSSDKVRKFVQKISFRYEVVFLIKNPNIGSNALCKKLREIGDSIDILAIKNQMKVHVHTDDTDKIKKIARDAGEIKNFRIEDLATEAKGKIYEKERNIGIVIDETSDIPEKIIKKYALGFVPFNIEWPEGEKLPGKNIYQKMREAEKRRVKKLPKTSQAAPKSFFEVYKKTINNSSNNSKVISIVLSLKLSGGYNSASQAAEMMDKPSKIFVLDSLQASSGSALIVLKAIELREDRKSFDEIIKELKALIPKIQLFGALEDPRWLAAGGRISTSQAVWAKRISKIGIRALFAIKEGKIEKGGVVFGASDLAIALYKKIKATSEKYRRKGKKIRVVINHCDNLKQAEKLRKMLKKIDAEVPYINLVGPVIGTHIGPGSLIAAWIPLN